jgi:ribosomal protein S18 acetylase RimI-like enzyme
LTERTTDPPPVRRPATARPRERGPQVTEEPGLAPTEVELEAIERHLADLALFGGAVARNDPSLGTRMISLPGRGPGLNFASSVRWTEADLASRVARLEEAMRSAGEWPSLVVAEGLTQPPDLAQRLAAAGWVEIEHERVMWTRRPPLVPHLDPWLRVEAVTLRTAAVQQGLEQDAFGLPDARAAERAENLSAAVASGALRGFLVLVHGTPVASARLSKGDGVAALSGISVATAHRRKGYGTLVTAIATRAGLATGNRLVWLSVDESNTPALSLYRALGFEPSFEWAHWVASAKNS